MQVIFAKITRLNQFSTTYRKKLGIHIGKNTFIKSNFYFYLDILDTHNFQNA